MDERLSKTGVFAFGPYRLSPVERVLRYRGRPVVLAPKTLDLLFELAAAPNHVISKHDLIERIWPDTDVNEANLSQNVYVLRQLFKRHQSGIAIENIPKRGYRLLVPSASEPVGPPEARPRSFVAGVATALVLCALCIVLLHVRDAPHDRTLRGGALANYLLARTYLTEASPSNLQRAAKLFASVAHESPDAAEGFAGLAEAKASLAYYAAGDAQRVRLQADAMDLAQAAVRKNPDSADAYAALGGVDFSIAHEEEPAQSNFRRSLALDPNQPDALVWYGTLLMNRGDVEQARRLFSRAFGIEPQSPGTAASLAWSDFLVGNDTEAIVLSKQMLRIHQLPSIAQLTLANAYIATHNLGEARHTIALLAQSPATRYQARALGAQLDALTGHPILARMELRRLDATANTAETDAWDAASIAAAYIAVRDEVRALAWLQRVDLYERRLIARDPRFAALAGDHRFIEWTNG